MRALTGILTTLTLGFIWVTATVWSYGVVGSIDVGLGQASLVGLWAVALYALSAAALVLALGGVVAIVTMVKARTASAGSASTLR